MWKKLLVLLFLTGASYVSYCQIVVDSLQDAVSVYAAQNMSFGAFSPGAAGGSVIISAEGTRSTTGTVNTYNMGVPFFQAIFEVEAPENSIISIMNGPDVTLTGSNGGSMSLKIGSSIPASPFNIQASPSGKTEVLMGGTLTVGTALSNPPGNYVGNFYVTFNQQ
jgi:hypothetical protein